MQIALLEQGKIVFEQSLPPTQPNRQESASVLLPSIDAAMKQLNWKKNELDLIAVGVGPGSFTGVRVSVITARTIAQGLGLGVYPVSFLEVLAGESSRPCSIVLSAGGGKYYTSIYGMDLFNLDKGELFAPLCTDLNETINALASYPEVKNLLLEPGLDQSQFSDDKSLLAYPTELNVAAAGAKLVWQRLLKVPDKLNRKSLASMFPWDNVLPLYLRSPSVTLKSNGSSNKTPNGG